MLIVQISDSHIEGMGQKAYGIAPTSESLSHCIAHINQLNPKPDIALITGDLTNDGDLEATQYAKKLLDELNCPYYIIAGNHDNREAIWSVFGKNACPDKVDGLINYVIDDYDVRLIGLDSKRLEHSGGQMCQSRLQWLQTQLNKQKHQPVIIFMHHSPVKSSVLETDVDGFENVAEFGDIIAKYSNIRAIICGHIHLPTSTLWNGTIVSTAPSTGMQLGLDLTMQRPSEFYLGEVGYMLHHYTKQKQLVSHVIYVRESNNGPYPFEQHPKA